jgi:8-oxo-dGTP pyrophosphatase MutT (NUDIX family)
MHDGATVMLVRDAEPSAGGGVEVFMMRRGLGGDFGGAHTFPGGKVDLGDRHAELEPWCEGRTDRECSELLGLDPPVGGLAFWVAAVRECFEEAGVLLAYDTRGAVLDLSDPEVEARFAAHRRAVDAGGRTLVEVCAEEHLRIAADAIHYFSHWITPEGRARRYDTRFFVARAPEAQVPLHDDREMIAQVWIRPDEALERHAAGDLDLILPTIRNLEAISRFADAESLMAAAAAIEAVPAILPRVVDDGGGTRIVLPGDPGYDEGGGLPEDLPLPGRPGGPALR